MVRSLFLDAGCVLRSGGGIGVSLERRFPNGFGPLVAYDAWFVDTVERTLAAGSSFGSDVVVDPEPILLEFVSANPTGPLHIGAVRWAAVGDSLARLPIRAEGPPGCCLPARRRCCLRSAWGPRARCRCCAQTTGPAAPGEKRPGPSFLTQGMRSGGKGFNRCPKSCGSACADPRFPGRDARTGRGYFPRRAKPSALRAPL